MSSYTTSTITAESFDASKITFDAPPKVLSNNAKLVFLKYGGKPLEVQTPPMKAPFGADTRPMENGEKTTLAGSFENHDSRPPLHALFDMMNSMDNKIVSAAMENQSAWWHPKKFFNEEVARAIYTPIVRYGKDKESGEVSMRYAPTMRMALKRNEGKWAFDVVDSDMNDISDKFKELVDAGCTRGAMFQAVIRATGIWISGSGFGVSWKVVSLRMNVSPPSASMHTFTVDPEDSELMKCVPRSSDDAAAAAIGAVPVPQPPLGAAIGNPPPRMIVDSDDDL